MMYGSPEARFWPEWCCTQKSHALRISDRSSLGRLARTCRRKASKRCSISAALMVLGGGGAGGWATGDTLSSSSDGFESPSAGGTLGVSPGIDCRRVAMLYYRPIKFQKHRQRAI